MKDDVLRRAALALREDADQAPARPDETRARVMRTLKAQRERRITAVRVIVPLAAVLVGSVAWAPATHRMPASWYRLTGAVGLGAHEAPAEPLAAPPSAPSPARTMAAPAIPAPAHEPAPSAHLPEPPNEELAKEPPPNEPPPPPSTEAPALAAPVAAPPRPSPPVTAPPRPAGPDEHALYRAAHDAHFGGRSPGAALAAWDAYLAAAPRGRFAVEAHYNRALCLVRLGRGAEARRALEPFARGAFGGYRQAEAQRLLDAMSGGER